MSTDHQQGRVVVITGGAGGIGSRLIAKFLANDDTVIATDVSAEALAKLTAEHAGQPRLHTVAADITDQEEVRKITAVARAQGGIDVLVNCAGWFPYQPFADTPQRCGAV